ncbi:AAA family ATPase [Kitasatospora sp. NPDC094016]|uniref:AAA family ATPase n=1 Tax=Kitasatospora sp. NPDC094016 TaxID=3154986 RepID=UPI0033183F99
MTLLVPPRRLNREVDEPSGLPAWPRLLLTGVEKSGKSYEAALASTSDLIGRTYWVEIGEDTAHEYKELGPYKIVRHDGSYLDILDAVRYAVHQPRDEDSKPNMIVVDSVTMLWELLCDEQTEVSRRRANERGAPPNSELTITADQWQKAKSRFKDVINTLKYHDGPVLLLARLEDVVLFDGDKPTRDRVWKVKAERSLPFECTAVVQLRGRDSAFLTGVRSLNPDLSTALIRPLPGFSVDKLFRDLRMHERVARSTYVAPNPGAFFREQAEQLDVLDDLPDDPSSEQLGKLIMLSFGTRNPEYLHRLTAFYGHETLSRRKVTGKDGPVSASDAIERALNVLAGATEVKAPQPGPAAGGPGGPEGEPPRCAVPACSTSTDQVRPYPAGLRCAQHSPQQQSSADASEQQAEGEAPAPHGSTPAATALGDAPAAEQHSSEADQAGIEQPVQERPNPAQMLRDEAAAQAMVLGISVDRHLTDLAPPGSTAGQLPPSRLAAHLRQWRPVVVTALRDKGFDDVADRYAALGTRAPAREAAEIIGAATRQ